jgi:hypothetical protein
MENSLYVVVLITICFGLFKYLEMKFVDKKTKPLKDLIRDTFIVFISSYFGFMLYDQLQTIEGVADTKPSTTVFIDKTDF